MTLAAGALFGLGWGTLIVSFASSLGATLAFLAARWLLGGWVQSRFGDRLATLNAGIAKDGGFYLFTLRLVPVVPVLRHQPRHGRDHAAHLDLLLGQPARHAGRHAGLRERRHAAGAHRVAVGHRVARRAGLAGAAGRVSARRTKAHRDVPVPARSTPASSSRKTFDRNLVVIGGGSAGLVTAYIAAAIKAKVTLVEKHAHGRRLPQHRLRAVQGADPLGQVPVARAARPGVRHALGAAPSSTSPR